MSSDIRADVPSWGRALASAECVIYAGNHWGMPCTIGLFRLINRHVTSISDMHEQHCFATSASITMLWHIDSCMRSQREDEALYELQRELFKDALQKTVSELLEWTSTGESHSGKPA